MNGFFLFFLVFHAYFVAYQWIKLRNLKKASRQAREKSLSILRKNQRLMHSAYLAVENFTKTRTLPVPLLNLPFADEAGIILDVKRVCLSSPFAPYNASIGCVRNKYYLFFRYDIPTSRQGIAAYISNIGSVQLDQNFNPLEETFCKIQTQSPFSEDPRFFQQGESSFLVYSDLASNSKSLRSLRIGAFNLEQQKLEYTTSLNLKSGKIEKNWTPFSHQGRIHFVYEIQSHQILSLLDPQKGSLKTIARSQPISSYWSNQWGVLRGGTPALLVDGKYLSFFHSSFEDRQGILWYVMGAYTFAALSPFKTTHISAHPILFRGIYDTVHQPIANPRVRSVYPVGLILRKSKAGDELVLSCGENDSGVKLITIDKNALFASLKAVD